ncbi:MAG: hypothetical protein ACREF9_12760 [Opitutaceae bacterium]
MVCGYDFASGCADAPNSGDIVWEASKAALGGAGGYLKGLVWNAPKALVTGVYEVLTTNPVTTVQNVADGLGTAAGNVVFNTRETVAAVGSHLSNPEHIGEAAFGVVTVLAPGALASKSGAVAKGGVAAESGIQFGQATVKSTFAHGPHAGKTIGEVAAGLRSGAISPNSLPVEYVVRNGQAVALNNRSLLALERAGLEPTITRNLTGNQAAEALLNSHLRGGAPSNVIRVRGGPAGTSLIE